MMLRCLAIFACLSPPAWAFDQQSIGDQITRALYQSPERVDDPILLGAASRLLRPIHQASDWRDQPLRLVILRNDQLNAFATPGGVMGLHTGLFNEAESADQVASVIAHEVAHLTQRHFIRRQDSQSKVQAAYLVGTLAALAAGFSGDPTLGTAAMSATQAAAIDQTLAFSREHEREADRVGLQLMSDAGYATDGMAAMFDRMQAAQQLAGQPLPYLSTHPLSTDRIADTRARARTDRDNIAVSDQEFRIWQAVGTGAGLNTLPLADIGRIGYQMQAWTWLQQDKTTQALDVIEQGQLSFPRDYALLIFKAQALAATKPEAALDLYAQAGELHPYFAQPYLDAESLARSLGWTAEFYYYGAWAAERSGQPAKAQRQWQRVSEMDSALAIKARGYLKPEN